MNSMWNPLNVWSEFSLIEKLVASLSVISLAATLAVLSSFDQLFPAFEINPEEAIAKAVMVQLDVRRKPPTYFSFYPLTQEAPLLNNDTVFSGVGSEVHIGFDDGTRLAVGENSLIIVRLIDGKIDVKLEKGSISGTFGKGKEIDITSKEEVLTLAGKKNESFTVFYKEGRGMGVSASGKRVRLTKKNREMIVARYSKSKKKSNKELERGDVVANSPIPSEFGIGHGDKKIHVSHQVPNFELPQNYKTPYPADNTYVLHKRGGTLYFFPQKKCEKSCTLKIYFNNALVSKNQFKAGVTPVAELKLNANTYGEVIWILQSQDQELDGQFTIQKHDALNIKKALTSGSSTKILN